MDKKTAILTSIADVFLSLKHMNFISIDNVEALEFRDGSYKGKTVLILKASDFSCLFSSIQEIASKIIEINSLYRISSEQDVEYLEYLHSHFNKNQEPWLTNECYNEHLIEIYKYIEK